jgi:hypothetical protein
MKIKILVSTFIVFTCFCSKAHADVEEKFTNISQEELLERDQKYCIKDFDVKINSENFSLNFITKSTGRIVAAGKQKRRRVENFKQDHKKTSWDYPEENVHIDTFKDNDHYNVQLSKLKNEAKDSSFSFPKLQAAEYFFPIGEGKRILSQDKDQLNYFKNEKLSLNESFSMSFAAVSNQKLAAIFISDNNYDRYLQGKDQQKKLNFEVINRFIAFNPKQAFSYRIYLTQNNPLAIAKIYQMDRIKHGQFTTLQEKAEKNPNINKLIGASHFYFWQQNILDKKDLNWEKLINKKTKPLLKHIGQLLKKHSEDGHKEYDHALTCLARGKAYDYEKRVILKAITSVLALTDFYDSNYFPKPDQKAQALLNKGTNHLTTAEIFALNKHLLASFLQKVMAPLDKLGQNSSTKIIQEMNDNGIKHAWLGLPNWNYGLSNPQFVQVATQQSYLVGSYDSYNSIHEKADSDWITGNFAHNSKIYKKDTIQKENGEFQTGFLGRGRAPNQTLITEAVTSRMQKLIDPCVPFNSWFLDCDAAGQIYNDYHPLHQTTIAEDISARLQRAHLFNEKAMVVGSEGGNDYFNQEMAFAHGLDTNVSAWGDKEMYKNKKSTYYIRAYYSMDGEIPGRYHKPVPLKKRYQKLFIDPKYSVPLYKLVYNESVITTHHWEWDSYKLKDLVGLRRLKEYLYNTPPLVHLDAKVWQEKKTRFDCK